MLLILFYAALFAAALWLLRARSPLPAASGTASSASPRAHAGKTNAAGRAALLSGEDLPPLARDEYFRNLSAECCTCGCDLTLRDCLLADQECTKSPELARALLAPPF